MKKVRLLFTLIELLVVITIIAILASMLLPSLSRAKDKARQSVCSGQLKQCGLAMGMYLDDWGEVFPWSEWVSGNQYQTIYKYLDEYIGDRTIWMCPERCARGSLSQACKYGLEPYYPIYPNVGWNSYLSSGAAAGGTTKMVEVTVPDKTVLFADCNHPVWASHKGRIAWASCSDAILYPSSGHTSEEYMTSTWSRHAGGENICWVDGHIEWLSSWAMWRDGDYSRYFAVSR